MLKREFGSLLLFFCLTMGQAFAQTFGEGTELSEASDENNAFQIDTDKKIEEDLTEEELKLRQKWLENNIFMPRGGLDVLNKKTEDGSRRGDSVVVEINDKGESRRAEKIFLYAENFKISNLIKNTVSCDMRFVVLANLDNKITQLDLKLVWPDMTTTLSFSNVRPNVPTYMDYTLMGEGCYSMDKMPNIVVNRCRVRGMSAVDCANSIVWLKMNNK